MSGKNLIGGRYELQHSLGRGGFGEVFLAYDRQLDREVAIKQIFGSVDDPGLKGQREREMRIHSKLSSSHVVSLFDSFIHEGTYYLVFELMDHSLAKYREPVEWKQVREWASDCLKGLQDIHAQGVIHRDIKPANIFIDRNGSIRIGDFGVAQAGVSTSLAAWTPKYIAPEVIIGDQSKVGPASDLYSLGLVIYQLILGEEGMKRAFPEIYEGVEREEAINNRWLLWQQNPERMAPTLTEYVPDLPQGVAEWALRIVQKDPGKRYNGAAIALEGLQQAASWEMAPGGPKPHPQANVAKMRRSKGLGNKRMKVIPRRILCAVGAVVILFIIGAFLISTLGEKKSVLVIEPSAIKDLKVEWKGEEMLSREHSQEFIVRRSSRGRLKVSKESQELVDTILTIGSKARVVVDVGAYLPKPRKEEALSAIVFEINVEALVKVVGQGEHKGRRIMFDLKEGSYEYSVEAEGYEDARGSFEAENGKDKQIAVSLHKKQVANKLKRETSGNLERQLVLDPVDHKQIDPAVIPFTYEFDGVVYYFASAENMEVFKADPLQWVSGNGTRSKPVSADSERFHGNIVSSLGSLESRERREEFQTPGFLTNDVRMERVWFEQKKKELVIHLRMRIFNHKDQRLSVGAYFYTPEGIKAVGVKEGYITEGAGQAYIALIVKPRYDQSYYEDFELEISYSAFGNLSAGICRLGFEVQVQLIKEPSRDLLYSSEIHYFEFLRK